MIEDVFDLMEMSEWHCDYSETDMERLIFPAINNGRLVLCYQDDLPVGLFSYTFLTPEAEEGYLNGGRKIQPEDWETDEAEGQLYVIDFIAPYNNAFDIAKKCRSYLDCHTTLASEGLFVRMARGKKLGRVGRPLESVTIH